MINTNQLSQDLNIIKNDIYHLLIEIKDPEFPQTLGELRVINEDDISVQEFNFSLDDNLLDKGIFFYVYELTIIISKIIQQIKLQIVVQNCKQIYVKIYWTPTVRHCGFAFQIVLAMRMKLSRELMGYSQFKIGIYLKPGSHLQENEINKQANDKERYRAAMENKSLYDFINNLI